MFAFVRKSLSNLKFGYVQIFLMTQFLESDTRQLEPVFAETPYFLKTSFFHVEILWTFLGEYLQTPNFHVPPY